MTQVKCANCEWIGDQGETEEIADFWSRVDVGGEVPAGDCPKCGAFAYLVKPATVPPADLLAALVEALPYVETAEHDDAYKPGAVAKVSKRMRAAIAQAEADTSSVPPPSTPKAAEYANRAIEMWCNDELSIDGEPAVSLAEDGAWVQAWVWVDA